MTTGPPDDRQRRIDELREEARRIASRVQAGERSPEVQRKSGFEDLDREERRQDISLKGRYGQGLFWLLGLQLLIANALMYLYAGLGKNWDVPDGVMQAWLAATVVQLIGVVAVVVRYLFPRR